MIKKFDLIAGSKKEIREYIENLDTFEKWQICKSYNTQVKYLLSRKCNMNHIGAITYQGLNENNQVVIHAAFAAII